MKPTKVFALLTILALSASAMLIAFSSGVLAASPSVPEFTLAYVDHSYDVPITRWTTTDPYTGAQISHSSGGEHVDNRTIDVTIKNQPFTPYKDASTSNQIVNLYYNIRSKGHFVDWDSANGGFGQSSLQASTSATTSISFNIGYSNVPQGGQIDFQVQATLSYVNSSYSGSCFTGSQTIVVGQSGWSGTQTLTIGNPTPSSPTPSQPITTPNQPNPTFNPYLPTASPISPNPTATSSLPNIITGALASINLEQTALVVMAVVIAVLAIALIVVLNRRGAAK
jgi:hypothetical protein